MINCTPVGGISNRMKCIISTIVEHQNINLVWGITNGQGGVGCEFNDLFTNKFIGEGIGNISSCDFIHKQMNTHIVGVKDDLPLELKQRYIDVISILNPIEYINNEIEKELDKLGEFSTVSVRTFRSFPKEYQSWGVHFKIENLFKEMNKIEGNILLTCDDPGVANLIKERYKVYTTPKRTRFGDFESVEGMQDILIDQYLGSKSKNIYGTAMSSFSEMQWWLGLGKSNYTQMSLHK